MRFAFEHEYVCATLLGQVISDTRSDDAAADDDDVRSFTHTMSDKLLLVDSFIIVRWDETTNLTLSDREAQFRFIRRNRLLNRGSSWRL